MSDVQVYDSTKDADAHREIIHEVMLRLINDLRNRDTNHDKSKYEDPERACYDKYIPMLKEAKYGSKEYEEIRKKMAEEGLDHHYSVNRHHPEHFENGIEGFTLVDLVEYFSDTFAASQKSDTSYADGLKINAEKHKLPPLLQQIFVNTVEAYFTDGKV